MAGYAAQIKAYRPGLVTMEEADARPTSLQLRTDGALVGLPYQVEIDRYDPYAFLWRRGTRSTRPMSSTTRSACPSSSR